MNKIKLTANILFAGVGMQERGIENSGLFDLDVVITSEIDKHAILSYAAVHHGLTKEQIDEEYTNTKVGIELDKDFYVDYLTTRKIGYDFQKRKMPDWSRCKPKELYMYYRACELNRNVGDIASVTELPYADLWTFSYPCTDLSISGDQKGMVKGLTRSGLVYEVTRLLEVANTNGTAPKFLLMENVDALVSKKFKPVYDALNEYFDTQGYNCYWQVLNAKDHGVPQSRKRVFALYIRKDVDNGKFTFPKPYDSGIKLRDILDKNVANKYFLSKEIQERFYPIESNTNVIGSTAPPFRTIGQSDLVYDKETYMSTLCARDYKQPKQIKEE